MMNGSPRSLKVFAGIAFLSYCALTLAESNDNESESLLLTGESIVFVYESHSQEKTADTVFAHAISQDFRDAKEEFTRYDLVQSLQSEIKEKLRQADKAKTIRVIAHGRLNEYDFERKLFPIDLGGPSDVPRQVWFEQHYAAKLTNIAGKIELPVPLDSAKKLAGELQKSRRVECVVEGRVTSAEQENANRTPPVRMVNVEADRIRVRFTSGREIGSLDLTISSS